MLDNFASTIHHAYATAARDAVKLWQFVHSKVIPALQNINADASVIETVTGQVNPGAEEIEKVAFAVLGLAVNALEGLPNPNGRATVEIPANVIEDIRKVADIIKKGMPPMPPGPQPSQPSVPGRYA